MKILLTGASGFVGSHILDRLLAQNLSTVVLLRPTSNRQFIEPNLQRVEVRLGSVNDPESLRRAMADVTQVIHAAGCIKALRVEEFYNVNHLGTQAIVQAINQQEGRIKRLVYVSSMAAGGPALPERPAREDDPPQPVSDYGKSKLAGEREVRETCRSEFVIVRPPAVYGPRDTEFLKLFKAVRSHVLPLPGGGRQALSFAFVEDLAEAIIACLNHPAAAGRIYNVASSEIVTARAFAEKIAAQLKTWTVPVPVPILALWPLCYLQETISRMTRTPNVLSRQKYPELRAGGWVCDPARLRKEIGVTCATTLQKGIATTCAWYRQQGWL